MAVTRLRIRRSSFLLLIALSLCAPLGAAERSAETESQLAFGVEMAGRGLWSEALFRFRQAQKRSPEDLRVLNNLAVALEATGRFDEALEVYRAALKVAPGDRSLKQNYARFVEFYQGFRPRTKPPATPATPAAATPAPSPTPAGG